MAQTPGDDSKGLDELTSLSLELELYDERPKAVEVSESLYVWLRERARRRDITPDASAEEILACYRAGRIREVNS